MKRRCNVCKRTKSPVSFHGASRVCRICISRKYRETQKQRGFPAVYMLDDGEAIKIGRTGLDIRKRLSTYDTHSSRQIRLIGFYRCTSEEDSKQIESEMKRAFAPHLVKGNEWFSRHPDVLAAAERMRLGSSPLHDIPNLMPPQAPDVAGYRQLATNSAASTAARKNTAFRFLARAMIEIEMPRSNDGMVAEADRDKWRSYAQDWWVSICDRPEFSDDDLATAMTNLGYPRARLAELIEKF